MLMMKTVVFKMSNMFSIKHWFMYCIQHTLLDCKILCNYWFSFYLI